MAKSSLDMGSLLKWGLILGGGYYLYETYVGKSTAAGSTGGSLTLADLTSAIRSALGTSAAATPPAGSGAAAPPPAPPALSTLAGLRAAILASAGVNDYSAGAGYVLSADQWNYYRNRVAPPDLSPDAFGKVIAAFPAGVTRDKLTIDQFLTALKASGVVSGLSGVGGLGGVTIQVPMLVDVNGRKGLVWATQQVTPGVAASPVGGGVEHPRPNYRRAG